MSPSTASASELVDLQDLIDALSSSIGEEKASAAVETAARSKGLQSSSCTQDQALAVLDVVSESPGLVGVAAKFARSRIVLAWTSNRLRHARFTWG